MSPAARPLTVFCDFDGTITERDMILTVCEKFCPPTYSSKEEDQASRSTGSPSPPTYSSKEEDQASREIGSLGPRGWERIKDDIIAQRITVRQGIAELFAMIPSSQKDAIIRYAQETVRWRAGFPEFLDFCEAQGIYFTVCSGGVDFFIEPLLAPFRRQIKKIYCIPADFSGPTIGLKFLPGCETCSLCKATVMKDYPQSISILIGDGITDLHGARHANIVYARRELTKYLDQEKIAYTPFETFHDIIGHLQTFQGHSHEPQPAHPAR